MSDSPRSIVEAEMNRTAFQRKAVSRLPASEVLALAVAFFKERGYRSGKTGRPGQVFVMGGREGALPGVTGEVSARSDVGRPGVTLVTIDGFGERLGEAMGAFHQELRNRRKAEREGSSPG
jgi:hypothetical protein